MRKKKSTCVQENNNCVNCIEAAQAFESESDLCDVDYPGPLVRDWVLTAHRRWLQFLYRMFGTGHWRGRGNNLGRCFDRGALSSHFSRKKNKGKHNISNSLFHPFIHILNFRMSMDVAPACLLLQETPPPLCVGDWHIPFFDFLEQVAFILCLWAHLRADSPANFKVWRATLFVLLNRFLPSAWKA